MLQRFHSHAAVDVQYARVPADDCAHIVAAHAAGGAVGHDEQGYTASDEVESAGDGAGAAKLGEPDDVTRAPQLLQCVGCDFRGMLLGAASKGCSAACFVVPLPTAMRATAMGLNTPT